MDVPWQSALGLLGRSDLLVAGLFVIVSLGHDSQIRGVSVGQTPFSARWTFLRVLVGLCILTSTRRLEQRILHLLLEIALKLLELQIELLDVISNLCETLFVGWLG